MIPHILTNTTIFVESYVNEPTNVSCSIQFRRPETGLRDALASSSLPATPTSANSPAEVLRTRLIEWLNYTSHMFDMSWPLYLP